MTSLKPSVDKSRRLRLLSLIIEGGALVLRHQFDKNFPPQNLRTDLLKQRVRCQINVLIKKKIIRTDQVDKLYPLLTDPCSSTFDITLLTCLLRNICGLAKPWDPVWSRWPPSQDVSIEADITRLRNYRNEISHLPRLELPENDFEAKWKEIETVLLRLGSSIPLLKDKIDDLYRETIDPEMEQNLQTIVTQLSNYDRTLEANMSTIQSQIEIQQTDIESLQDQMSGQHVRTAEISRKLRNTEETTNQLKTEIEILKKGKAHHQTSTRVPKPLSHFIATSEEYFNEHTPEYFVSTEIFRDVTVWLPTVVLLKGPAGEGKTALAIQVMKEICPSKLHVKVDTPDELRYVLRHDNIGAILIDDIFGRDVVDKDLVRQWQSLPIKLLSSLGKRANIKIIITVRDYILKMVKDEIGETWFGDRYFDISSKILTKEEKSKILEVHFQTRHIAYDKAMLDECVNYAEDSSGTDCKCTFGFPECANMYTKYDYISKIGPTFFSKPANFLRNCIEGIYRDMKQFLPLAIMWAVPGQKLTKEELADLELPSKSRNIHLISQKFGFKLKGNLIRKLRRSLDSFDGYFTFDSATGSYCFSQPVISDVVGLILSRDYADVVLDACSDNFLMNYTTLDPSRNDGFHFLVDKYHFKKLGHRLGALIFSLKSFDMHYMKLIERGRCFTTFSPTFVIDTSKFLHDAFSDSDFIDCFIAMLTKEQREVIISCPIVTMVGFFLGHGIFIRRQPLHLPSYALLLDRELLFQKLWNKNLFPQKSEKELGMSLLVATHMKQEMTVNFLVKIGIQINDNALYIAAENDDTNILSALVGFDEHAENRIKIEHFPIANGNSPLIAAVKQCSVAAVRILVQYGADIDYSNGNKLSALNKAILGSGIPTRKAYQRKGTTSFGNLDQREGTTSFGNLDLISLELVRVLLENGASVNMKAGKYKQTPLHMAADLGKAQMVELLLSHGADHKVKDWRHQTPIHSALLRKYAGKDVVRVLLHHDPSQINWKLSYYSPKSKLRGMTVFHIACKKLFYGEWINELDESQINFNARDHFGRTPAYMAAWNGNSFLIDYLLDKSDLNIPDKQGYTPLHAAVNRNLIYIAGKLYSTANLNAQDKYGKTPFHVACEKGNIQIVKDMLDAGRNLDIHILTNKGESVFHILAKKFHHHPSADIAREMRGWETITWENKWVEIYELLRNYDPKFAEKARDLGS